MSKSSAALVETYSHMDPGYRSVLTHQGWQVAFYNTADADSPEAIRTFDRHTGTDEVFVLLSGRCLLVLGGAEDAADEITGVDMKPGVVYNVKTGTWHAHVLTPGSQVLIVENSDAVFGTTEKHTLTQEQREAVLLVCSGQ